LFRLRQAKIRKHIAGADFGGMHTLVIPEQVLTPNLIFAR
jgi:hypothetical protein